MNTVLFILFVAIGTLVVSALVSFCIFGVETTRLAVRSWFGAAPPDDNGGVVVGMDFASLQHPGSFFAMDFGYPQRPRRPQPMYRQGDVLIERVTANARKWAADSLRKIAANPSPIPRDNGRVVLAYGEVTGHAHAIADHGVVAWGLPGNQMLLEVTDRPATLRHEEHGAIELPPGEYVVTRQREFTSENEFAYVAD